MGALVACWDCGFVTRRHGPTGLAGECPHCRRQLTPISFAAARDLQLRKRERARAAGHGQTARAPLHDGDGPRVSP